MSVNPRVLTSHLFTRRRAIQTITAVCCCAASASAGVSTAQGRRIDQITDANATAATNMFRFEPNLLQVSPGEEIAILNSRGEHTVHSVPQLWPEGVPRVAITNTPEAIVRFPEEGLYAFRCRRHGPYGMVMLVAAGDVGDLTKAGAMIDQMRARKREKQAFVDLLTSYEALRA